MHGYLFQFLPPPQQQWIKSRAFWRPMVEEEKLVFVQQIDICLCLFVRHPPQRLVISQPDKVPLLDGAIAARQAGRQAAH